VHLRYWPDELELEIIDDGRGDGAASNSSGGLGLIGTRERAAFHGGQLAPGPAAGGGLAGRAGAEFESMPRRAEYAGRHRQIGGLTDGSQRRSSCQQGRERQSVSGNGARQNGWRHVHQWCGS
jgi:hypothetical protein